MVPAEPALWAEPAQCSGAAKNIPPFEMGVGNLVQILYPPGMQLHLKGVVLWKM